MPEEIIPGREVPHYLSLPQFAARLGLKGYTLRKYKLPPKDITWGVGFPAGRRSPSTNGTPTGPGNAE